MTDVLIRDVPEGVISALDRRASRLGISRAELIRRQVILTAFDSEVEVGVDSLRAFASTFADLEDESVMDSAWR